MSQSLCSFFQPPLTSSLIDSNIVCSALFSMFSVYVLPVMWRSKFFIHIKQQAKFSFILIFTFLDSNQRDRRLYLVFTLYLTFMTIKIEIPFVFLSFCRGHHWQGNCVSSSEQWWDYWLKWTGQGRIHGQWHSWSAATGYENLGVLGFQLLLAYCGLDSWDWNCSQEANYIIQTVSQLSAHVCMLLTLSLMVLVSVVFYYAGNTIARSSVFRLQFFTL
jgi:hypothetical protein